MNIPIHTRWKLNVTTTLLGIILMTLTNGRAADPRTNSWFTTYSGKYARIYTTDANKTNGVAVTTWSNGGTVQATPAYSGVQEVYSSSNWVYLRSSGLGSHVMGPWYLNAAHTTAFPGWPTNQHVLYKIPRYPTVPVSKTQNKGGSIGYFVDGVTMFNSWDAQYWNGTAEVNSTGNSGYWNRDAYVNEGVTFDPANAHQPGSGQYHYHANPPALRYFLGDHVDFNLTNKAYTESASTPTKHSPIIGWVADGYPIYGPYGYSISNNAASGIRLMVPGYVLRNGQFGSQNLTSVGRSYLPQWAVRMYGVASNILAGPAVSTTYPLGHYMEDNDYLGDLGYTQGTNTFDLDEYNGRWCVTPEFPGGTYAYFTAISSNGTPLFPYNIGFQYYGNPTGASTTSITESVVTNYFGGPNAVPSLNSPTAKNGTVTLSWSAIEGGTYLVLSTTNLTTWITNSTTVSAVLNAASYTNNPTDKYRFYRVAETALATYDSPGTGGYTSSGGGGGSGATFAVPGSGVVSRGSGTNITLNITLPGTPPSPPTTDPITSVTLGTLTATSTSYTTQGTVVANFTIPANATTGTQTVVVTFQNGPPPFTFSSALTINP